VRYRKTGRSNKYGIPEYVDEIDRLHYFKFAPPGSLQDHAVKIAAIALCLFLVVFVFGIFQGSFFI